MKKSKLVILAALMTVSSSASASPFVDCEFVKIEAIKGVNAYKDLTKMMKKENYTKQDKDQFMKLRQWARDDTNMFANVYSTFCK